MTTRTNDYGQMATGQMTTWTNDYMIDSTIPILGDTDTWRIINVQF